MKKGKVRSHLSTICKDKIQKNIGLKYHIWNFKNVRIHRWIDFKMSDKNRSEIRLKSIDEAYFLKIENFYSSTDKSWKSYGSIGFLTHCCYRYKLVQTHWKIAWNYLSKLEITYCDSAVSVLGICLGGTLVHNRQNIGIKGCML